MQNIDPKDLFFAQTDIDLDRAVKFTDGALHGADDGELYLEYTLSEAFSFDDNRLKAASFDTAQGFGLRAVNNEAVGYAHSTDLTQAALKRAADSLSPVLAGHQGSWADAPLVAGTPLYVAENPLDSAGFTDKVELLAEINAYTRARDNRVRQVSVALNGEWQAVGIIRPDSAPVFDIRPLVRLDVSVVVGEGDRQETGHSGRGGRAGYAQWLAPENWQQQADNAFAKR